MVDRRLQHLALGAEPEAIVEQFGVTHRQLVLEVRRTAIERELFDAAMREVIDRAARRFVHAARFHADEAVLDQVEPANTVLAPELVLRGQQRRRAHRFAVQRDAVALFEIDRDDFGLVGRVLRVDGARIDVIGHCLPRILEHLALGRSVQQVRVGRKRRFAALVLGHHDLVLLGEVDQRGAAGQVPLAPRRDHLDVGGERVIAEFEADLVIALACRAVRHRVGAHLTRDLNLALGDQRPRDRRAEQVQPLVQRVGAHHREDVIADEFLAQIVDEDMLGLHPRRFGLLARRLQLLALAQIGGEGHHFALIGFLQPFQDHAGVEAARIGKDDTIDFFRHGNAPTGQGTRAL